MYLSLTVGALPPIHCLVVIVGWGPPVVRAQPLTAECGMRPPRGSRDVHWFWASRVLPVATCRMPVELGMGLGIGLLKIRIHI